MVFLLTTKQTHESGSSTKLSATEVFRVAIRYQKNPFPRECQLKKKRKKRIEGKKKGSEKEKGKKKKENRQTKTKQNLIKTN